MIIELIIITRRLRLLNYFLTQYEYNKTTTEKNLITVERRTLKLGIHANGVRRRPRSFPGSTAPLRRHRPTALHGALYVAMLFSKALVGNGVIKTNKYSLITTTTPLPRTARVRVCVCMCTIVNFFRVAVHFLVATYQ